MENASLDTPKQKRRYRKPAEQIATMDAVIRLAGETESSLRKTCAAIGITYTSFIKYQHTYAGKAQDAKRIQAAAAVIEATDAREKLTKDETSSTPPPEAPPAKISSKTNSFSNVFAALLACRHDEDFEAAPREGFESTDACPGSKAKLAILAMRAHMGQPLWHPDDVTCFDKDAK